MIQKLTLAALLAAIVIAGCGSGEEAPDPNAGKGPVKEGAGDTKAAPTPNETGP